MNEIALAYVPHDLSQPRYYDDDKHVMQSGPINPVTRAPMANVTQWLESLPRYWLGRAYTRKPQPGCDPLSKDYAHDMLLVGRYEDMAQQLERK